MGSPSRAGTPTLLRRAASPANRAPIRNVGDSFEVVDVSSPTNPTMVGALSNSALPPPWTGTNALKHATSVAVSGNYAYVTASYSNRLTVLDISDPHNPTIVSSLQDSNRLNFDVDVAVQNGYAYVADQASGLGRMAVVDVRDPVHPLVAGSVTNSTLLNGAYRIRVRGNFAYVSAVYAAAVSAIDISNPQAPQFLNGYQSTALLNRTTGLDVDSTSQFVVGVSPYLSTESQPIYPPYPLMPGGPVDTGTVTVASLDPSPLSIAINQASKPPNPTTQTSANFTFTPSDDVVYLRCQLDNDLPTVCTALSGQTLTGIAPGAHTFTASATDPAGETATDSYTWTITAPPPAPPPSTPVLDNFNRANGAVGSNWGLMNGGFATFQVLSQQAVAPSGTTYAWNFWQQQQFGPDSDVYTTLATTSSDAVRVCARITSPTTTSRSGYCAQISGSAWTLVRIDKGTSVVLATGSQTVGAGDKLGLTVTGSALVAWYAPAATGTWTRILTATDTTYTSAGYLAMESRASHLDDFGGGTSATPPHLVTRPSISGSQTAGQTLTADPGSWSGSPAPSYSYQWQQCDSGGQNCQPILTATQSSYQLQAGDVGHTIAVSVTGQNAAGQQTATSSPVGPINAAPTPPQNQTLPSISGSQTAGQTLTADPGSWTGSPAPSYSYQWQQCDSGGQNCQPILTATQSSYQLQAGDVGQKIAVSVTGQNAAGQQTATSSPVGPINAAPTPPQNQTLPSISGSQTAGQTLTADPGSWTGSPAPSYSYQWQQCDSGGQNCQPILTATQSSYQLQAGDVGQKIAVSVTGQNAAGQQTATSSPVGPINTAPTPPQNQTLPSISGSQTAGQTLTADPGSWSGSPAPSYSYQWQQCDSGGQNCQPILTATQSSYQLQAGDVGQKITVSVTGQNAAGQQTATSSPVGPINTAPTPPQNQTLPSISGSQTAGQTLTADPGSWSGSPAPSYSYQWQQCDSGGQNCQPILTATQSSYQLQAGDVGQKIAVSVTGQNAAGQQTATSSPVGPINTAPTPPQNQTLPSISGSQTAGQTLTADPGSWSGSPAPSYSYQWQQCDSGGQNCQPILTATQSSYQLQAGDVGQKIAVSVTGQNAAGQQTATSSPVGPINTAPTPPQNQTLPSISGSQTAGQTLTADPGSWSGSPAPSYSYQWQQCDSGGQNCQPILTATQSSYQLQAGDVGQKITVSVTGQNAAGQQTATSSPVGPINTAPTPPQNQTLPSISGSQTAGQTLTADPGSWSGSPAPSYSYQWQQCDSGGQNCQPILTATQSSYQLQAGDVGQKITVSVTGQNAAGQATATATPVGPINAAPPQGPVLDNFNRANGTLGSNWALVFGGFANFQISAQQAVDPSTTSYAWNYWQQQFGPNSEVYGTFATTSSDAVRVCARVTTPTTANRSGYCLQDSGSTWTLIRIDKGSSVTLATVTQTVAPGDRLGLTVTGSTLAAWYAPATTGTWTRILTTTDTKYPTAGYLALESRASHLDDFGGRTVVP